MVCKFHMRRLWVCYSLGASQLSQRTGTTQGLWQEWGGVSVAVGSLGQHDARVSQSSEGFQDVSLQCQGHRYPQDSSPAVPGCHRHPQGSPAAHLNAVLVQPLVQADPEVYVGFGHPDGHIHRNSNGTEAQLAGQQWQGISSVSLRFSLTYSKNFCYKFSWIKYFLSHNGTGPLTRQTLENHLQSKPKKLQCPSSKTQNYTLGRILWQGTGKKSICPWYWKEAFQVFLAEVMGPNPGSPGAAAHPGSTEMQGRQNRAVLPAVTQLWHQGSESSALQSWSWRRRCPWEPQQVSAAPSAAPGTAKTGCWASGKFVFIFWQASVNCSKQNLASNKI